MSVEETLASMANSQITQKMPSLTPHLLGFELIDSNEEGDFAVGVTVGMIGDTYIYVPIILRRGRIYDVDIMYLPELDQFVPVDDNWVSYIRSKKTDIESYVLDKSNEVVTAAGNVNLDMPFNNITKIASEGAIALTKEAGRHMFEILENVEDFELQSPLNMLDLCSNKAIKKLASYVDTPEGANVFAKFYTQEQLQAIAEEASKRDSFGAHFNYVTGTDTKGTVKILTSTSADAKLLSDDDKVNILRDGAIIKDTRGLTPTLIYKAKQNSEWMEPNATGLWELLQLDGKTMTAYVIPYFRTPRGETKKKEEYFIVPMDDSKSRQPLYYEGSLMGQRYDESIFKDVDIAGVGKSYPALVSALRSDDNEPVYLGNAYIAIRDVQGNEIFLQSWGQQKPSVITGGDEDYIKGLFLRNRDCENPRNIGAQPEDIDTIIIGKPDSKLRQVGKVLRLPENAKVFIASRNSDIAKTKLANLADISNYLQAVKKRGDLLSLLVTKAGGKLSYNANGTVKEMSAYKPLEFAKELVQDFAIKTDEAIDIVKEASSMPSSYMLKVADDTKVSLFAADLPAEQIESTAPSIPMMMSDDDKAVLDSAQATGVKEIFDISLLKLMAAEDDPINMIQEWIPGLFTAMDSLARVLYLCRAGAAMAEAYGDSRADMLERKIKKQVQAVGDTILSLQQGQVQSAQELLAQGI